MPQYVPPKPTSNIQSTIINSILSRRRHQLQLPKIYSKSVSQLTIGRLKLAIYLSILLMGLANLLDVNHKIYVDCTSISLIFVYYVSVYGGTPPAFTILIAIFFAKGMLITII